MRIIVIFLSVVSLAWGEGKGAFYPLVNELQSSSQSVERLLQKKAIRLERGALERFVSDTKAVFAIGYELSGKNPIDRGELSGYLRELRHLSQTKAKINSLYRSALLQAIGDGDTQRFEELVSVPMEPLYTPRLRSETLAFYHRHYKNGSIPLLDTLFEAEKLEQRSIQIAIEQEQAYEEHLRILKRSEVEKVKKKAQIGSRNSVILSADVNAMGGFEFEAENLNPYTVTVSIDFDLLSNLKASGKLPMFVEIPGRSKKKVLELLRISPHLGVDYRSSYGWVRGSAFAVHQDDYLYRLPFAPGSVVNVSQGYHGGFSHKGLSAYAIDFPVPSGTRVYAAREGIVVGSEGSHAIGGADPAYRQYANYVIIEHSDGTMGNYYHLQKGGAVVSIGEKVARGDLIGYSGNTGYSSGAHLHFSVSKVDPVSMRRPMNLPVKIETAQGIVILPQKGDRYTVQ